MSPCIEMGQFWKLLCMYREHPCILHDHPKPEGGLWFWPVNSKCAVQPTPSKFFAIFQNNNTSVAVGCRSCF